MIPAHGRQSRWISELEANLVYKSSSRIAKATKKNPLWEGGGGEGRGREYKGSRKWCSLQPVQVFIKPAPSKDIVLCT